MPNAVKWIANVGKSLGYSMIDELKTLNPTLKAFKEDNEDFAKSLYTTVNSKDIKEANNKLSENQYFKLAKDAIDNLKSDIKTGKLYNREREKKAEASMFGMDFDFNFDDADFGFDDDNDDTTDFNFSSEENTQEAIMESAKSINKTADLVGEKASMAISNAVVGSSEFIVKSGRKNTKAIFDQNNVLYSKIHADLGTINTNITSIIEFAKEATVPHYNNSATFYTTMTTKIEETNSLLKELVDMQKEVYGKKNKSYSSDFKPNNYSNIVNSNGTPNLSAFFENAKNNINDKLGLLTGALDMITGTGMQSLLTASPGKLLTNGLIKLLTPKDLKEAFKDFNNTLSGVFANMLIKMNENKNSVDGGIKGLLASIFGTDEHLKTGISTHNYKKDAVPFDGITRKAITEVIPTYLSKILSVLSNENETRYDYEQGRFVSLEDIKKQFKDITSANSRMAAYDMNSAMMELANKTVKFDKDQNGNFITEDQFRRDLQAFFEYQYRKAKIFNGRKDNINPATYGMKGGQKSEISARLIKDLWNGLPNSERMKLAGEILDQRKSQSQAMRQIELEGDSVLLNLFNDSGANKFSAFNKKADGMKDDAHAASAKYTGNVVSILNDIRKEVSYIRTYGVGGNVRYKYKKDNKVSNNIDFDKFNPYEDNTPLQEETTTYYSSSYVGMVDKDGKPLPPIEKKDGETQEEFEARVRERIKAGNKSKNGKKIIEDLMDATTSGGTLKAIFKNINTILQSPANFLTTIIRKADESVFDLVFGENGSKENKGILYDISAGIRKTFSNVDEWLKDNIFEPLKEKLTVDNLKTGISKIFGLFGLDYDAISATAKEFIDETKSKITKKLFGEKDKDGKRIENGLFGKFIDDTKKSLMDSLGWVKGTVNEAAEWMGLKGVYNEEGLKKKKRKDTAIALEKRLKEEEKKKREQSESDDILVGQAALGIKRVPKTGVYALSQGEAVIPPDYNPANIRKRYKNEQAAIDKYKKHGGISMLAPGSDPELAEEKQRKGSKYSTYEAKINKVKEIKDNIKFTKDDYEELPLLMGIGEELGKAFKVLKSFTGKITANTQEAIDKEVSEETKEIVNTFIPQMKEYLPDITAGAILGGGVSLLTGMIGGPILGAAVGAGTGLLVKSKTVQNLLFGEFDPESNEYKNGLLPKKVTEAITKYIPGMGKGATLGGIVGLIPGGFGPVAGIILGSTAGFVAKNEKVYNALFGEESLLHDFPNKVKKALPKMGAGAVVGAVAGPFGIATNLMLGSAVGFATDTNKFKDYFFGEEDENGNRSGGLMDAVVNVVADPIKNFVLDNTADFREWFKNTVADNLSKFFNPLSNYVTHLMDNISDFFKEKVYNKIINPMESRIKFILSPLGKAFNSLFDFGKGIADKTIGFIPRMIGNIGTNWTARQIKSGRAFNMTAQERLDYRDQNNINDKKDKTRAMDETIAGLNLDQLSTIKDSVDFLNTSNSSARKNINKNTRLLNNSLKENTGSLNRKELKQLRKYLNDNKYAQAKAYISRLRSLDEDTKTRLIEDINNYGNEIARSKYIREGLNSKGKTKKEFQNEIAKNKSNLYSLGIDLNNIDLKDLSRLLNIEVENKSLLKESENINDDAYEASKKTEEFQNNIIGNLNDIIDQIKLLNQQLIGPGVDVGAQDPKKLQKDIRKAERKADKFNNKRDKVQRKYDKEDEKLKKAIKKNQKNSISIDDLDSDEDSVEIEQAARGLLGTPRNGLYALSKGEYVIPKLAEGTEDIVEKDKNDLNKNRSAVRLRLIDKLLQKEIADVDKSGKIGKLLLEDNNETQSTTEQVTEFYNGMPIKMYKDEKGDLHPDTSDSETVETIKAREEDRTTQKGILSSIKDVPGRIIEFFGGHRKDDKKKNNNLFAKILKIAGIAMVGTALAPYIGKFFSETVVPVLGKLFNKVKDVLSDFKDGLLGKGDGEGLPELIGSKIRTGAIFITDWLSGSGEFKNKGLPNLLPDLIKNKIAPLLLNGFDYLMQNVVPKAAELVVKALPSVLKGLWKGITGLGGVLLDAITHKNVDPDDSYTIVGSSDVKIDNITKTNTSGIKYTPSSAWNLSGTINTDVGTFGSKTTKSGISVTDTGSTKVLDKNADEFKELKAYNETASNRIDKIKDQVNSNLNKVYTLNGKSYSLAEILNSDEIVAGVKEDNSTGELKDIYGYQLLNYPELAAQFGIDTSLSLTEREEQNKKEGYKTTKEYHPTLRPIHSIITSALTGRPIREAIKNSKPAKKIGKAGEWVYNKTLGKSPIVGKFFKGAGKVAKVTSDIGGTAADLASKYLPEYIVGSKRKNAATAKKVNKGIEIANNADEYLKKSTKGYKYGSVMDNSYAFLNSGDAYESGLDIVADLGDATDPNSKISKAAKKFNNTKLASKLDNYVSKLKNLINKLFKENEVISKILDILNVGENKVKTVTKAINDAGEKLAKELGEKIIQKCSGTILEKAGTKIASFLATGGLSLIATAITSFTWGMYNADNIAQILTEDVDPMLRVVCGFFNAINEVYIVGGLIDSSLLFNLLINVLSAITDKDIFNLDKLQEKAENRRVEENAKRGTNMSLDDLNNENKVAYKTTKELASYQLLPDGTMVPVIESKASGTPYITKSGLYALSEGEYVGKIPMLAEGTVPNIGSIKDNIKSSYTTNYLQDMYDYASSGDDKFLIRLSDETDTTTKMVNLVAKRIFNPVYAMEKMQKSIIDKLSSETGDGDKVLEKFNKTLADTNKYLTGKATMKNYWNDSLENDTSMYGNMAKVMTTIHKTLLLPMIMTKSLFQNMSGQKGSGTVDAVSTNNNTTDTTTSDLNATTIDTKSSTTSKDSKKSTSILGMAKNAVNTVKEKALSIGSTIVGGVKNLFGKGSYVGGGTEAPDVATPNVYNTKIYKYTNDPKVKSLTNTNISKLTLNRSSVGDNFVSQNNGDIANTKFNTRLDTTNQTVSDSGCAPAVATMVINSIRGKSAIDMNTAVKDALQYKVPNSGVSSNYFDDEFSKYGISTEYISNDNPNDINKSAIVKAINENRPTILLGQDSDNNNKSKSPFGPNPHYVVAESISKDGKYIYINDPESKTPRTRYSLKDILPKVKVGITTFIGRKVRQASNKLKMYIGGAKTQVKASSGDYIGRHVKQFESGNRGPNCVGSCGNDGGCSYGTYQMVYKYNGQPGSAQYFWNQYYASKYGNQSSVQDLKTKWLNAVKEEGEDAFFVKEWQYILDNYYKAALLNIRAKGFDPDTYSRAMQECIWSWAVHRGAGGCVSEFAKVLAQFSDPMNVDEVTLLNACYDQRAAELNGGAWSSISTGRYGTGSDSERAKILSLVGQSPIDYTAPDGVLSDGSSPGSDSSETTSNSGEKSIIDIILSPFDALAKSYKLIGDTTTTTTSGSDSTQYNSDGISGTVSSNQEIAQKQVKVVSQMNSVYGKLKYAQDNAKYPGSRDPDTGSGDCSSTVQWAYKKALGVDVGGWSGGQKDSSNTYIVDKGNNASGKPNESNLQLGDILLYGTDAGAHAEMYSGNGQVLTHGDPAKLGPTFASLTRRNDYWGAKRLNQFKSTGTSTFSGSGSGIGRGSFVSQLDPKYASKEFNIPGDTTKQTIGDSGCAPAAATMVLNDVFGNGSGMLDSTKLALKYKQNNDGVSSDYFKDIYSRNGLNTNYYNRKEQVTSDLRNGKDVVLLGSDKTNTSKTNSPFGPNPHYVVASGMSRDGKSITIKDPESRSPKKYNTRKILDSTKLGIGYGSGLKKLKSKLRKFVGRGFGQFSGILYVGDSRTDMMKDCISEDGVYFIASVGAGLSWLKNNAASQIKAKIKEDPNLAIVFNFGVNDLYNSSNYIKWYTQFEQENPDAKIYFMSVNPVDKDPDGYATDAGVQKFNTAMQSHFGGKYLDVYSYLKSSGYKTTDGLHYDDDTSKKIHERVKELLGGVSTSTTSSTTTTTSFLDSIMGVMGNLASAYGLTIKTSDSNNTNSTGNTSIGPGSTFPTYNLTDSQLNDVATCITGETGGNDLFASMQEASQMANLNEVTYGKSNTGDNLYNTLHGGWYASSSWSRGVTDIAKQAAKSVLVEGKRTLPRYVTEHDTFPMDIVNAKDRSEYKLGDPVSNRYGSNYKFYDFFGQNKDGDISGYFQKDYDKYSGDQPWSVGSGSGLFSNRYLKSNTGRGSEDVLSALSKYTEQLGTTMQTVTTNGSTTATKDDTSSLLKAIIKLLAQIVDNTQDVSEIVEILSKIVNIQSDSTKAGAKQDLTNLKSQLVNKLNNYNRSNTGSDNLSVLMDSIENLAME